MAASAEPSKGLCPNAAAYMQHPRDHTSEEAVIVPEEGTSNSSGALWEGGFVSEWCVGTNALPVLSSAGLGTCLL